MRSINELTSEMMDEFGFCNCGSPDVFVQNFAHYLQGVIDMRVPSPAELPYVYIADKYKYTEHGSSILGAWATTKGEIWLCEYRMAVKEEE